MEGNEEDEDHNNDGGMTATAVSASPVPVPVVPVSVSVSLPGEGEGGPSGPFLPESPTRRMFMALTSRYQVINFVKKFIVFLIMKYVL